MTSDLGRVAEDYGNLKSVHISEFQPGWIETVRLEFESGDLTVSANGDDDTIRWALGSPDEAAGTTPNEWLPLLSSRVRWVWLLTNHRGYQDGLQIEFSLNAQSTYVQFMVEGSRLLLYRFEVADS